MKDLTIEWRHYAKGGTTCDRCAATGASVKDVVAEVTESLSKAGVRVTFIETILPAELLAQSNMILFNGIPLEEVLDDARTSESSCPSCSCLTGADRSCRTIERDGEVYEEVPPELIREAIRKLTLMQIE